MSSEINKSSPASIRDFLKVDEERQVLTIEPPKIFFNLIHVIDSLSNELIHEFWENLYKDLK